VLFKPALVVVVLKAKGILRLESFSFFLLRRIGRKEKLLLVLHEVGAFCMHGTSFFQPAKPTWAKTAVEWRHDLSPVSCSE